MKFFAVSRERGADNRKRVDALAQACNQREVEFVDLLINEVDFLDLPKLGPGDLLYQVDRGAMVLERMLIRPGVATFYKDFHRALFQQVQLPSFAHHGVPMPKTIPFVTNDQSLLEKYVAELGGFPVILKVLGLSHGAGVHKVETITDLIEKLADLSSDQRVIMREFIDQQQHARLIVIGDRVVDSIEYQATGEDFRTNAGDIPSVRSKKFSPEVEATAVKAVRALELEFGGVDIMFDADGNHYVLETNFPCYFMRAQEATGTDIAGLMVEYLMEKSQKLQQDKEI